MRLLVDMNLSPRWVGVLAGAGIEAVHWSTLGANNASDSEIMAYARANDSIVLTHDLDFGAISQLLTRPFDQTDQSKKPGSSPGFCLRYQVLLQLLEVLDHIRRGPLHRADKLALNLSVLIDQEALGIRKRSIKRA